MATAIISISLLLCFVLSKRKFFFFPMEHLVMLRGYLLLTKYSGIIPGCAWDAGAQTWVDFKQGKNPAHCAIAPVPASVFYNNNIKITTIFYIIFPLVMYLEYLFSDY